MFPFLGARRGKAAVLEVIRQIADNVRVHRFDREIDHAGRRFGGLDAALFADRAATPNKPISLRLAHFAQFKAGRLLSIRVLRRHLRSGGAGARAPDPSAEDRLGRVIVRRF